MSEIINAILLMLAGFILGKSVADYERDSENIKKEQANEQAEG